MNRLIITGANGSGKSHLARRCAAARPDVAIVSFDALKLTTGWAQRPRADIDTALRREIAHDAWILEGGPTLLPLALPRADAVIWLDPPDGLRAWRLLIRPWKRMGRARPELPEGNVDWPLEQYRFAWRSLRKSRTMRGFIEGRLAAARDTPIWRCTTNQQIDTALTAWGARTKTEAM